jgi:hypothetical protein
MIKSEATQKSNTIYGQPLHGKEDNFKSRSKNKYKINLVEKASFHLIALFD